MLETEEKFEGKTVGTISGFCGGFLCTASCRSNMSHQHGWEFPSAHQPVFLRDNPNVL